MIYNSKARRNLIARQSGNHLHDFPQLLIGWRGEVACEFERESTSLKAGVIAVVPDGVDHYFSGLDDKSELLVVDISPVDPFLSALEDACNFSFKEALFNQSAFVLTAPDIQPILEFAGSQLEKSIGINPQLNCQLTTLFLTQICQENRPESSLLLKSSRLNVERLNSIIDSQIDSSLSNAKLANLLHVSESHFYYLCQRQFGMTPQQYVMQKRMQKAQYLVYNTSLPFTILAADLGFSDASSFSRAYKKHFSVTPSNVRRMLKS